MLVLDGSYGEGGGQILRTSCLWPPLPAEPFAGEYSLRPIQTRSAPPTPHRRQGPGPHYQGYFTAMTSAPTRLTFSPQGIFPGTYTFNVAEKTGSAGSVSLVAQTLLPVLLFAESPSTLVIKGGTHVPWSPPAHYLAEVFLPALKEMGRRQNWTSGTGGFILRAGARSTYLNPVPRFKPVDWMAHRS